MIPIAKEGRNGLSRRSFLVRAGSCGLAAASLAFLAGCGGADIPLNSTNTGATPDPANTLFSGTLARSNDQMRSIVETFIGFNAPPLPTLTAQQARQQPSIQDAERVLRTRQGRPLTQEAVASVRDTTVPGPAGAIPVRVYTPSGTGPFPVIVYFHGGGWVIATIDTYDASCRALANEANAVVISVEYRKGPESRFPAAHEDAYAATQFIINNAAQFGGDGARVATAGESAGGNLATAVCIMARDRGGRLPVYQVPIYPIANNDLNAPSVVENQDARPLNRPNIEFFLANYLNNLAESNNPLISIARANLAGLPPATIITAEIDPLRSEGQLLANNLRAAGVGVRYRNFTGVTHEFFSLNRTVDEGREAVEFAADGLRSVFENDD